MLSFGVKLDGYYEKELIYILAIFDFLIHEFCVKIQAALNDTTETYICRLVINILKNLFSNRYVLFEFFFFNKKSYHYNFI